MSYDVYRFENIIKEMESLLEEAYEILPNGSHCSSISYASWYSTIKSAIHDEEENEYGMNEALKQLRSLD